MLLLQKFWVLSIFFVFPQYWAVKWIKTINFQCVPFEPNSKIFKEFSNNAFVLLDYLWSKFHQDRTIFGRIKAKKTKNKQTKRGNFMDAKSIHETLKIFNFTKPYAILMKLTTDIYMS